MKRLHIFTLALLATFSLLTSSCEQIANALGVSSKPELSSRGISIDSLDSEGITFKYDYSISNPYPVSLSIAGISAKIEYDGTDNVENPPSFTVATKNGLSIAANENASNAMNFVVPYDTILNFVNIVQSLSGKTSLPFAVQGNITLDLSAVGLSNLTLPIPKLSVAIPVFKPKLSVNTDSVQFDTSNISLANVTTALGLTVISDPSILTDITSGNASSAAVNALQKTNLNVGLNFNLDVAKEGTAPWNFAVNTCGLTSTDGSSLANVSPDSSTSTISSESGSVPMSATISASNAAAYIIQLIGKNAKNPTFVLNSALSFPELQQYGMNIPLNYSYELPIN